MPDVMGICKTGYIGVINLSHVYNTLSTYFSFHPFHDNWLCAKHLFLFNYTLLKHFPSPYKLYRFLFILWWQVHQHKDNLSRFMYLTLWHKPRTLPFRSKGWEHRHPSLGFRWGVGGGEKTEIATVFNLTIWYYPENEWINEWMKEWMSTNLIVPLTFGHGMVRLRSRACVDSLITFRPSTAHAHTVSFIVPLVPL